MHQIRQTQKCRRISRRYWIRKTSAKHLLAIFTRHTLLRKYYWMTFFFLFPVTDISATVVPIGVKLCMMVHIGAGQVVGGPPRDPQIRNVGPNFGYLTANISKKVSRSVRCQLERKGVSIATQLNSTRRRAEFSCVAIDVCL